MCVHIVCTYMYVCVYVCMHACMYVYEGECSCCCEVHARVIVCASTHVHARKCVIERERGVCVCVHTCYYVCMHVCVIVCVFALYVTFKHQATPFGSLKPFALSIRRYVLSLSIMHSASSSYLFVQLNFSVCYCRSMGFPVIVSHFSVIVSLTRHLYCC